MAAFPVRRIQRQGSSRERSDIRFMVELVPDNGHHDEAPEPQRTLSSWAEFMAEEPVNPKGRGYKFPAHHRFSLRRWGG